MASRQRSSDTLKQIHLPKASQPETARPKAIRLFPDMAAVIQQTVTHPQTPLHHHDFMALQRTIGNSAINRLLGQKAKSHPTTNTPSRQLLQSNAHHTYPTIQRKIAFDYTKIEKENLETVQQIVKMAFEYMMSSKTGKTVWEELDKAEEEIQIQVRADSYAPTTFSAFSLFGSDPEEEDIKKYLNVTSNLFVRWNVMDLLKLDPENPNHLIPKSGPNTQSVANALVHELGHARQLLHPGMKDHTLRWRRGERMAMKGKNGKLAGLYNTLLELHNLLNHEIPFSLETGEPVRTEYTAGSKGLSLTQAFQDAKQRLEQSKPTEITTEKELFSRVEKQIIELEGKVLNMEMSSRNYSLPPNIDMEKVEEELSKLEDELLQEMEEEVPSYLTPPLPYKI